MTFLNPILLYAGLACIAVPIIVHLLTRRRRKPIAWGAMRFLLEAYKKHRRRLTLEQLILLVCRCALVALVALALGKPIVDGMAAGVSGPRVLYLVIDNSLTSALTADDGRSALDRHKDAAASLLAKLDTLRGDRAALIALGAPAEPLIVPPSSDLTAVGRVVEGLEVTDGRADVVGAVSRIAADLGTGEPGANVTVALLSEWRAGSADIDRPLPSLAASVRPGEGIPLVLAAEPAVDAVDNVSVVRAEPLRPILVSHESPDSKDAPEAESNPVRVVLARRGPGVGAAAVTNLSVRVDTVGSGGKKGTPTEASVRWNPGQEQASVTVAVATPAPVTSTSAPAIIAEIDRDALAADNTRRRPIESRPWLAVGLATTPGSARPASIDRFAAADWLRLSVSPDRDGAPGADLRVLDVEPRTIGAGGALSGLDALIIPSPDRIDDSGWTRIGEFARGGGLVVVFAPAEEGVQLWADGFLKAVGANWTVAREARGYTPPTDLADAPGASDLLALLSGEFAELAKPVRVSRVVPVEAAQGSGDVLLRLRDGTPFVLAMAPRGAEDASKGSASRGLVVLFAGACDLRWTDLPTKPLMVPLMQEIVRQGIGAARGVWAGDAGGVPSVPAGTVELRAVDTSDAISLTGGAPSAVRRAALWTARDARGSSLGLVATNPDLAGADTTPRATAQLTPWLGSLAGPQRVQWSAELAGTAQAQGRAASSALETENRPPVSAPLLAAAAAVALLELLLARIFSHATVASGTAPASPARSAAS